MAQKLNIKVLKTTIEKQGNSIFFMLAIIMLFFNSCKNTNMKDTEVLDQIVLYPAIENLEEVHGMSESKIFNLKG